jgi:aryl-phospho-beta-D-glucosidase BglC (GH1 family)
MAQAGSRDALKTGAQGRRGFLRLALYGTAGLAALGLEGCRLPRITVPAQVDNATPVSTGQSPWPSPTPGDRVALEPVTWQRLPRWRGFNLLEKFTLDGSQPYQEWDFRFAAGQGFNFFRLPTDYRIWTTAPGEYREGPLQEIDQAVAWGHAYGIHINLCLHRAPGYCVNPPAEVLDLWADDAGGEEARRQFAAQWQMFARRYRGVSSSALSFDLVNEPPEIDPGIYVRALRAAVDAIRAEDPQRLVIADGLSYGTKPGDGLLPLQVAQSTRGYIPMTLSHYRASWIEGSDSWPVPTWPVAASPNIFLYGTDKADFQSPLVLLGDFVQSAGLIIHVDQVSASAVLVVRADGQEILRKAFQPGPGSGEWKSSAYHPEWKIYQAVYDQDYSAQVPAGTRRLELALVSGDWLTFSRIRIQPYPAAPGGEVVILPGDSQWAVRQGTFTLDPAGNLQSDRPAAFDRQVLWDQYVAPFVALKDQGVGVHVGEWGAYSFTPHAVVLAWMRDCLANWQRAGMGWALWNLRGDFGPLDSGRADVTYESLDGHLLDRAMLEVLKQG